MEAFGDAVTSAKAPHTPDFGLPLVQRLAERLQWGEVALTQAFDVTEELSGKRPACPGIAAVEEQQLAQALAYFIQNPGSGLVLEVPRQPVALFGAEVFGMTSQQRHQSTVLQGRRIE